MTVTMSDDENMKEKADDESLCDFEMMYNGPGSHSPELSESTLVRFGLLRFDLFF